MKASAAWVALLLLGACGDSYPGGGRHDGSGGAGGTGGEDRGEPAYEVTPSAGIDLAVRSQLFAPAYDADGLLPSSYTIILLDEGLACDAPGGLRLDDGEAWLTVTVVRPAVGDCAVWFDELTWDWPPPPPPETGCLAFVSTGRQGFAATDAREGVLHIDRLDATTLAGTLRLRFPERPVRTYGCSGAWGNYYQGECDCMGPDGLFRCETTNEAAPDCCDDGAALTDVSFAFEASRCAAAGSCRVQPCLPDLAAACAPAPRPPASCEAACAAYVDACRSCLGCPGQSCEEMELCDPRDCLATCENLASVDPQVSLSLACAGAAASCGEWASCVSACGEP